MDLIDQYFFNFSKGDVSKISDLLHEEIVLQDPFVGKVEGKELVLSIYRDLFLGNKVEIEVKRRFSSDTGQAVEFSLILEDQGGKRTHIDGVDVIESNENKISFIRAFLDVKSS